MSLSMNVLNWIGSKIGVEVVDTTQDDQQQSSNRAYDGLYPDEHRAIPLEQNSVVFTAPAFSSFPQSSSLPSRYRDSMNDIDKGSFSASPAAGQSTLHTPSLSPLQSGSVSMNEGLRTSSMRYPNTFSNGTVTGSQAPPPPPPPLSSSHEYVPLQREEDDVVGVVEPIGIPPPSSPAHVLEQLVGVDAVLLQARAQEAKEKVMEFSHVAQGKVSEYVGKASSWVGTLQDAVKKTIPRDYFSSGRSGGFVHDGNGDPRVNNEVDAQGLPVSKQWYVFNDQLNRWDVSEEAPWEVRQEFHEQLQKIEAAKQQQQLMGGTGGSGPLLSPPPPPPPPPPPSSWKNIENEGDVGNDGQGGGRRVDTHRPFSLQAPQYAQPSYFFTPSSTASIPPPPTAADPRLPASLPLSFSITALQPASTVSPLPHGVPAFAEGLSEAPTERTTGVVFPSPPPSSSSSVAATTASNPFPLLPSPSAPHHHDFGRIPAPGFSLSSGSAVEPLAGFPAPPPSAFPYPTAMEGETEGSSGWHRPAETLFPTGVTSTTPPRMPAGVTNRSPATAPLSSVRCHPNPLQSLARKKGVMRSSSLVSSRPAAPSAVEQSNAGGSSGVAGAIAPTPPLTAVSSLSLDPSLPQAVSPTSQRPLFPAGTTAAVPPLPSSSLIPSSLSQSGSSERSVENALQKSASGAMPMAESAVQEEGSSSAFIPCDPLMRSPLHPGLLSTHTVTEREAPLPGRVSTKVDAEGRRSASEDGSLKTAFQGGEGLTTLLAHPVTHSSLHHSGVRESHLPPPPPPLASLSDPQGEIPCRTPDATPSTTIAALSTTLLDTVPHKGSGENLALPHSGGESLSVAGASQSSVTGFSPSGAVVPPPFPTAAKTRMNSLSLPPSPKDAPAAATVSSALLSSLSHSSTSLPKKEDSKPFSLGNVGSGATPDSALLRGSTSSMGSTSAALGASDASHKRVKAIPPPPSFTPFELDS